MVTWGTSPEDCAPVDGVVPDPAGIDDGDRRRHVERALDYMQLKPATPLQEIAIDRVFIGSCTNSRIEDLRAAAKVLKGRRVSVPGMVSPGSQGVKRQAEAEGLDRIFIDAGLEWRDSGCSMCNGSNGELVAPGERCASTTNRNFEGRQGRGALTHIMSPAMVAAAAVFGRLADVRRLTRHEARMQPFTVLTAVAAPLEIAKIDTGMILPGRYMRRHRRPGHDYGEAFLYDLRFDDKGSPAPISRPTSRPTATRKFSSPISDFGCGSSREGAAFAVMDFGLQALVGAELRRNLPGELHPERHRRGHAAGSRRSTISGGNCAKSPARRSPSICRTRR